VTLTRPSILEIADAVTLEFHPLTNQPGTVRVTVAKLADGRTLEFNYAANTTLQLESIRLLDQVLWTTGDGYVVVPVREGLLVPANSGLSFTQRFDTYAYEGCHMEMFGMVKDGAAALVTWNDPYVTLELRSTMGNPASKDQGPVSSTATKQVLSPSLLLRKSANSFRVQLLGKGDYVTIAKAYREIAKETGLLVTWDEKLKQNPERAKYFGASNYKLWSTLDRRMNDDSSKEDRVRASVIPIFELVYRDCIAMYGKYGYDPAQAAEYVLHHIAMGRPLNYHNIPSHLYWKESARTRPRRSSTQARASSATQQSPAAQSCCRPLALWWSRPRLSPSAPRNRTACGMPPLPCSPCARWMPNLSRPQRKSASATPSATTG